MWGLIWVIGSVDLLTNSPNPRSSGFYGVKAVYIRVYSDIQGFRGLGVWGFGVHGLGFGEWGLGVQGL